MDNIVYTVVNVKLEMFNVFLAVKKHYAKVMQVFEPHLAKC